jgi:thymidylate kinase
MGRLVRQRTNRFIVFLGTDGSGKSSVINGVCDGLEREGYETRKFHLRVPFIEDSGAVPVPVVDPHGKRPHAKWLSAAKVFYLLFYYWWGHFFKVRPLLKRNTVVVFDRYYHDMLVDPKRYRYGGSAWLARLAGWLIPKPGLWILLDAPADVLQSRKQEVPFAETVRQRKEYLKQIKKMKNGVVVDASKILDEVVADAHEVVLSFIAEQPEKTLGR